MSDYAPESNESYDAAVSAAETLAEMGYDCEVVNVAESEAGDE